MFSNIWKGYFPEENHVGYVTNGVHFPTWTATEWRKLYDTYFDKNFMKYQDAVDSHPCTYRREPRRSSRDRLVLEYELYREKKREPTKEPG